MAAPTSSSLFMSLENVWRLLSLRSDIDDIILELLGHFSLEKLYAGGDKETYQNLVITLLAQLNAIFYIQRLTLPTENLQIGWYLQFIASWEITLRSVEFVLQVVLEGRDNLWEAQSLRDKYLANLLLSALRILILHPKAPLNQRAKDRRERFARIHRYLERIYDSYPGPTSFLLLVCKELTDALRTEPMALLLPQKLRFELPNLASELYPLPDCFNSHYITTTIPQEGFAGSWLSQFLALRDVSLFVVGASIQYAVNGETRNVRLQASSARTRNAVLTALDSLRIPSHLLKTDLVSTFSEIFRILLPETRSLVRRRSTDTQNDESEMDAIDALCLRLRDRQAIHRLSDREIMHGVTEITRNIVLLDDPTGQTRNPHPKLYVTNCKSSHFAGESQLILFEGMKFPNEPREDAKISLPPNSECFECGEPVTFCREISLARHTYELLKPLETSANTLSLERHLPTQFLLLPPRAKTGNFFPPEYSAMNSGSNTHFPEVGSSTQQVGALIQSLRTEFAFENKRSTDGGQLSSHTHVEPCSTRENVMVTPFSPDSIGCLPSLQHSTTEKSASDAAFYSGSVLKSRTIPVLSAPPDKGKTGWRSKLTRSRKEADRSSGDTRSPSSSSVDLPKAEEISLKSLTTIPKGAVKSKSGKTIKVHLSQNSSLALFWTQSTIRIFDVGSSPPTLMRAISTEGTCILAAVTKFYLAYIIGTRDQKLTLRIMSHIQPSVPVVQYKLSSSPWCRSLCISPQENCIAVGFEDSSVRFFNTAGSEDPREDRLHPYHQDCKGCPPVDSLSFSNDGLVLLAGTRSPKSGTIQIFSWRFPFTTFQELSTCRYRVPLHESEDNGISSAIFRSSPSNEGSLICITTWTQSGLPLLIQLEENHRSEIRTESANKQGTLGSRIQCAVFSSSGQELSMVNEKGHLYQISSLNSNTIDIRRVATSKELTAKSESFAMAYMTLSGEEGIVLAWAESAKSLGFVKKIPLRFDVDVVVGLPRTPSFLPYATSLYPTHAELEGNAHHQNSKSAAELIVTEQNISQLPKETSYLQRDST